MRGSDLNQSLALQASHALYREDGKWYHHLTKFPGILFDKDGYLIVQTREDYQSNPNFQHGVDLHVTGGIASLNGYQFFSAEQKRQIALSVKKNLDEETLRVIRQIGIIVRNRQLVDTIKETYKNTCQVCGIQLEIQEGIYYSEVHHIKPLGNPHNGPDKLENMICVCPLQSSDFCFQLPNLRNSGRKRAGARAANLWL